MLLEEGQSCKTHYFVEKGCVRMFFLNSKGVEQTTQFAIENWWITDHMAFQLQKPASFYIQSVEASQLLALDFQVQEKLFLRFPQMESYFRQLYERAYAASQTRVKYLYDLSKEDHYRNFIEKYPGFAQRIPQYLLASFLGFTPEYLSEIRKKHRS
jgi:CRP-like cAMP-binding protein